MSYELEHGGVWLSELLDGGLSPAERERADAHLAGCAACRSLLDELAGVRDGAAALTASGPAADLWPAIAGRLPTRTPLRATSRRPRAWHRTFAISIPQLAAAGLAMTALGAGLVWTLADRAPAEPVAATEAETASASNAVLASLPSGESALLLEQSVAELEAVVAENRALLGDETVAVLEQNVAIIDAAIAEIRAALEQDPASVYLNRTLTATMRRKLDVLRVAATSAQI